MNDKVGFITPDNQKIWLDYRETRNFCIDLCFLEERKKRRQKLLTR